MIIVLFISFLSLVIAHGYRWYYDRANYTLFRSNNSVDLKKPRFQAINGDEVAFSRNLNLGCTQNTRRCKELAHFDRRLRLRMNTPPCCRHNLILTYYDVLDVLEEFNFSYSLEGGSVLGAYRDKGHIKIGDFFMSI
ncbi:hypothetical protein ACOME3_010407 [Neoechinorhynchus agilis]